MSETAVALVGILLNILLFAVLGMCVHYHRQTLRYLREAAEVRAETDQLRQQRMGQRPGPAARPTPEVDWVDVASSLQAEHEAERARRANPGMHYGHVQTGDDIPTPVDPPVPVDPDNPPKVVVYRPKTGSAPVRCACHAKPVLPGRTVLMWPVPGSGEVRLYCQREDGQ